MIQFQPDKFKWKGKRNVTVNTANINVLFLAATYWKFSVL